MRLPFLQPAGSLPPGTKPLYIGALGFEPRGEQWLKCHASRGLTGGSALLFDYYPPKAQSRELELRSELNRVGLASVHIISANLTQLVTLELTMDQRLETALNNCDEVVLDISGMSKLLILLSIAKLRQYPGRVRIIYTELADYAPTQAEFKAALAKGINLSTPFPSRGIESVVRTPALSSIRMQGQPVTLIAFTSFNEQLVRHIVASVSPHRLILIGGIPPRLSWRETATQKIHQSVIKEYRIYNPIDQKGRLINRVSTLYFQETYDMLLRLYGEWGSYERIVAAATGSKMQTLGLALAKQVLPDIHIEYPTPRSYYVTDNPDQIASVHEIKFDKFRDTIDKLRRVALNFQPLYLDAG
jgi:hypothetical protein